MRYKFILVIVAYYFSQQSVNASEINILRVAVASNFAEPLRQLADNYEQEHNTRLKLSTASSGVLFAQIRHGAPFDVFLSADITRPEQLEQLGYIVSGSRASYAQGNIVLWMPQQDEPSLALFKQQKRVAMANPRFAPYGAAALDFLASQQLLAGLKLVKGANVNQAFQYADSGNIPVGIVPKSLLLQAAARQKNEKYFRYWEIPAQSYQPVIQQMVILKRTQNLASAKQFSQYLLSNKIQNRLQSMGYSPVSKGQQQ